MRIRSAASGDFEAVVGLLETLGRRRVTAATRDACRATYEAQVADPDCQHLLAEDDSGAVVGFCSLHYRARLNYAEPQAWIPDLIVAKAARRRGAGRALLEEARRRAAERGAFDLTLESGHQRTEAHLLYAAFGMDDTGKQLRMDP